MSKKSQCAGEDDLFGETVSLRFWCDGIFTPRPLSLLRLLLEQESLNASRACSPRRLSQIVRSLVAITSLRKSVLSVLFDVYAFLFCTNFDDVAQEPLGDLREL